MSHKTSFDFKKMKESIFKKLKKKKRKELAGMPGVYDELPPPRPADDTYLKPKLKQAEEEAASSGIPTLPPPPPKPMTPDTSFDDTGAGQARASTSFAGVMLKAPPISVPPGHTENTGFDPVISSSPTRPRDSRHILHENEDGDEVEYAIAKKESTKKPEASGLSVKDRVKALDTSVMSEESDLYLEPNLANLGKEPSEISRYARHIDVSKGTNTYQDNSLESEANTQSAKLKAVSTTNQQSSPKLEYRYNGALADTPTSPTGKAEIDINSNVPVSPFKLPQTERLKQSPFSYIAASKGVPNITRNSTHSSKGHEASMLKDYTEQDHSKMWRNTNTVDNPLKQPEPELSTDNFSFDKPMHNIHSPVKTTSVHWSDSTKSNKSEARIPTTIQKQASVPNEEYQSTTVTPRQSSVPHVTQRQPSVPDDENHSTAVTQRQFSVPNNGYQSTTVTARNTPPLLQQTSLIEEDETQNEPVVQNIFEKYSDKRHHGGTIGSRSSRTKTVPTTAVGYKSQTSKEAGTQVSDEAISPPEALHTVNMYGNRQNDESRVSHRQNVSPVPTTEDPRKETGTQVSDEVISPPEELRFSYMYGNRQNDESRVSHRQNVSPVPTTVHPSTSYQGNSHRLISTETQTELGVDPVMERSHRVVMKTRGTTAMPETDHFGQYRDTSSEEDATSRVHSVPVENPFGAGVKIEEYQEVATQTSDADILGDSSKLKYIRPRAYNPDVKDRNRLPESWQSRMQESQTFEEDSELSTRLSSDWYTKDDMPDLWDPDKMLKTFARELDRKSSLQSPTSHVELREEFNPKKYLQYVPKQDSSGLQFPPWKRLVMAKQMAEKAQFEEDMKHQKSDVEMRMESLPVWKKAIMQKHKT